MNAVAYSALVSAGGGGSAELAGRRHHERPDLVPLRAERDRLLRDRVLAPMARLVAHGVVDAEARLGERRPVVVAEAEHDERRRVSELNRGRLLGRVGNRVEVHAARNASKRSFCDEKSATSVS